MHPSHDRVGSSLRITPPLEPADVDYLAEAAAVVDWPGRPASRCPWEPCAEGCCLRLLPDRCAPLVPGAAAQWLRFLVRTYLSPHHRLDGQVLLVAAHGLVQSVLLVECGEVFEGVIDEPAHRDTG